MIRWDAAGYVVAFTTRVGGVSDGRLRVAQSHGAHRRRPGRVDENRRRACDAARPRRRAAGVQPAGARATVHRARPARGEPGDGLWTRRAGAADARARGRLPADRDRAHRRRAALAVCTPAGAASPTASSRPACGARRRATAAVVGPAIGPCCYEVGPEVSERFDADLTAGGMLDLWTAAERALRRAGVASVERVDLCTRCQPGAVLLAPAQRPPRGVQGVIGAVA